MTDLHIGDLANQAAQKLQDAHVDELMAQPDTVLAEEPSLHAEARDNIFSKIEFRWRTSDQKILEQIRLGSNRMFKDLFDEAVNAVDVLYGSVRVPELDEQGKTQYDGQGRVVWQTDSRGRCTEDWSRLTSADIETCLFELARLKLFLAPQLNELLTEAIFAKHAADDSFSDSFSKLLEGTIPDRNSFAASQSRQDKYFAFFRYCLYSQADSFSKEIDNFTRLLERVRYWRIDDRKR